MNTSAVSASDIKRRSHASRLTSLAIDMLDEEPEQIVRDYLRHALGALERLGEPVGGESSTYIIDASRPVID